MLGIPARDVYGSRVFPALLATKSWQALPASKAAAVLPCRGVPKVTAGVGMDPADKGHAPGNGWSGSSRPKNASWCRSQGAVRRLGRQLDAVYNTAHDVNLPNSKARNWASSCTPPAETSGVARTFTLRTIGTRSRSERSRPDRSSAIPPAFEVRGGERPGCGEHLHRQHLRCSLPQRCDLANQRVDSAAVAAR